MENSTARALELSGLNASEVRDARPCDIGAGPWRPSGGVVDGQGCYADGEDGNKLGVGCGYGADAQDTSIAFGFTMPYVLFFPTTPAGANVGGQPYLEWRRYNAYQLVAIAVWLGVVLPLVIFGVVHRRVRRRRVVRHAVVAAWSLVLLGLFGAYLGEHANLNNLVGVVARAFGGVAAGGLSVLIVLPTLRHVRVLDDSKEKRVYLHRFLALILVGATFLHALLIAWAHAIVYHRGAVAASYDFCACNATSAAEAALECAGTFEGNVSWPEAARMGVARLVEWEIGWPHGPPLAGLLAFVGMLAMSVTGFFFRRSQWALFSYIHWIVYPFVLAMMFVHYPSTVFLSVPALVLFGVDRVLSLRTRVRGEATLVFARTYEACGVTRLRVRVSPHFFGRGGGGASSVPGTWVVLRVDGLGFGSIAHPFSVSRVTSALHPDASSLSPLRSRSLQFNDELDYGGGGGGGGGGHGVDDDGEESLHLLGSCEIDLSVKRSGPWTNHMHDVFSSRLAKAPRVTLDGPFGQAVASCAGANDDDAVLLCVAGGIGVTPWMCAWSCEAMRCARLILVWVMRDLALIEPFEQQLAEGSTLPGRRCIVYVTRGGGGDEQRVAELGSHVEVRRGRPTEMRDVVSEFSPTHCFACGPPRLVDAVEEASKKCDVSFEREEFEF